MSGRTITARTKALIGVAVCVVVVNAALLLWPQRAEKGLLLLEPLNVNGTLGGDRTTFPLARFNGKVWTVGDKPINQLEDYLLDTDKWEVPHTFGKIMLLELPYEAGGESFRPSAASLAEHGICRVAVFQSDTPAEEQGLATAVRVRAYQDAEGRSRQCIDRVNGES